MPNRKNAIIELRKDAKKRQRNSEVKSVLKTERKKFDKIIAEGDKDKASAELKSITSVIDKTVKKGVIPAGKGSRLKSRYAGKVNSL